MNTWEIVILALALAMDAFAVSVGAGATLQRVTPGHYFRLSFHFGLFQFLMPVAGWFAGRAIHDRIAAFDHWVAFALLLLIGIRMVAESRRAPDPASPADPSRGWTLVGLAVATSIDALAVGVSLAFLEVGIWHASVIIGVVAAVASVAGVRIGDALGRLIGKRAELLGGLILIAIGLKILAEHL